MPSPRSEVNGSLDRVEGTCQPMLGVMRPAPRGVFAPLAFVDERDLLTMSLILPTLADGLTGNRSKRPSVGLGA